MSFEPPAGILDIGNATLRVGKLEVAETSGLNQGLLNIVKNNILITENTEYASSNTWGIKLPTTWVADFDVKGHSGKYVEFNFYNEDKTSNALGYLLNFKDTTLSLMYDTSLDDDQNILATATIPTIFNTYRKVNIFFERGVISVSIDGTRYLYHKETDGFNQGLGVASRVVSATGGAFVNVFIEENASNSKFKNLRIVNGRFISDKTSNIAFIGGNLGVGVHSPKESLDIRGNMHLTRVSNVSQIKVDSNVVTEYTGPHDRPLRKYPEVAFPLSTSSESAASGATTFTYKGYTVTSNSVYSGTAYKISNAFDGTATSWSGNLGDYDSNGDVASGRTANYLQIQLPNAIKLENIKITSEANYEYANGPRNITLYGSNNGSNWVTLKTETDLPLDGGTTNPDPQTAFVHVNTTTKYLYYKLEISKIYISSGGATYARIGEWELYGHEEGSASLDTTLKTVYNVPATTGTQLEVYYDAKDLTAMPATVTDLAGGNQNGTPGTGVTFDSTYKAFVFDGTTNGKIVGTHNLSGTSPVLTMSFWMKRTTVVGNYDYIATIGTSTTGQMIGVTTNPSNQFNFGNFGDGVITQEPILLNQWYHVTLVANGEAAFNSTNFKIYINGKEPRLSSHGGGSTTNLTGTQLTLGTNTNSAEAFNGSIANFRLFSKALNADQIKELYDYQKDYFLGSKSQVTLYKGHLGVGVTEPSGQLELAGDERIQEYPPRALTGYQTLVEGHGVFCVSQSSLRSGHQGWHAFEKTNTGTFKYASEASGGDTFGGTDTAYNGSNRLSSSTPLGAWLKIELPHKIRLQYTSIAASGSTEQAEDFGIYGSNDDNTWDQLFQKTGATANSNFVDYVINSVSCYKYFAILVTRLISSTTILAIDEWKLFGTPGPTTLDKGSLTLGRSLDVPRISRYDVDTETPRPEKLVVDFDTTVNSSPTDISGQGNHGTLVGATYSAPDKAFTFSGNQYIQGDTGLTGNFTHSISMWFNANNNGQLFWTGINANSGDRLNIFFSDDGGLGGNTTTPQIHYTFKGHAHYANVNLDQWHHLVCTYSGTDSSNRKIYIDGVPTGSDDITDGSRSSGDAHALNIQTSTFYLNKSNYSNGSLVGQISQFKLYNVALEPSEVKKLYNLGRTGRSMVISDTAVGIGKVPEAQLDVRGLIKGVNATTSVAAWSVARSTNIDNVSQTTTLHWDDVQYNIGGCYTNPNFTAPISGYYYHSMHMITKNDAEATQVSYYINDVDVDVNADFGAYDDASSGYGHRNIAGSWILYLNAGDRLKMVLKDGSMNNNLNRWSGFFLST